MSDLIVCSCYLFVCTSYMFNCSCYLFNYFNSCVVCFNNLLAYTRRLFFYRLVFLRFLANLRDIISDCNLCTCCLFAWTCRCVLCSSNLLVRSYRLLNLRHLRKLSKPICKTLNSTLQSKFCKKACIVLLRSGNFPNCFGWHSVSVRHIYLLLVIVCFC